MNRPDEEILAAARARLADWPDHDTRFGGSSPAIAKPVALPPGFQIDDRPQPGEFGIHDLKLHARNGAAATEKTRKRSRKCPRGINGHDWRDAGLNARGNPQRACKRCSTRQVIHPGTVLAPRRIPGEVCPKTGQPHVWREAQVDRYGRVQQVHRCAGCKTRRLIPDVAA